jgi:tRNA (cmo5U34)-methyltransferase
LVLIGAVLRALPFAADDAFSVLELGAGTGLLTAIMLHHFPNAQVTLVDVSAANLDRARRRLAPFADQLTWVEADFARTDPPGLFDVVVSAQAIHHISDLDKRTLYRSLYYALNRLGSVIIADRLHGSTPATYALFKNFWRREVGEAGAAEADIEQAARSMAEDYHSTLNEHLEWLRNSGFLYIDVHYKNALYAVFGGHRSDV